MSKITREQAQEYSSQMAIKKDVLFIEWCTGFGKTKAAIDIQEDFHRLMYPKVLVFIAERAHKLNWMNEYKEYYPDQYEGMLNSTYFSCYNSIHKYKETEWDLVICDEAHHLSPARIFSLSTIKAKKYIFLSATMKWTVKDVLVNMYQRAGMSIGFYKITMKQAIESEVLPEPVIYLHKLSLNNKDITAVYTPKPYYYYFLREGSITNTRDEDVINSMFQGFEKIMYLLESNRYDEYNHYVQKLYEDRKKEYLD